MALTFVFGNSGSGKSTYIYRKTVQMAMEEPHRNFYVVVPEQFTMQTQKALVGASVHHVIMNIDVVSFERLAYRVFDELGKTHGGRAVLTVLEPVGLVGLLAVCTAYLVDGSFNPFLYFRF